MAALGFMILFVGCLATGSTRYKVYRAWRSRVGGRISCAVVCLNLSINSYFGSNVPSVLSLHPFKFHLVTSLKFSVYGHNVYPKYCLDADVVLLGNRYICIYDLLEFVL